MASPRLPHRAAARLLPFHLHGCADGARALCLALALAGGAAMAQPAAPAPRSTHDIPAGALGPALSRFAATAGVTLSFEPALTQGLRTAGLQGAHTLADGLVQLLAGSGLEAVAMQGGGYTLRRAAAPAGPTATAAPADYTLREVRVTGRRDGETEGSGSYTSDAITVGKTAQALREMPQSVSVFTKQRMDDQNITSLGQAAEQIVGLTVQDGNHRLTQLYSRGFLLESVQFDGGAPMSTGNYAIPVYDMSQYDRVEVLRGVAGLLNGTGNPGGAINLVRKMPTPTPQFSFTASAGSWDNYRTEVDASGPLAFDGKLRGRAVLALQDRQYFTDGQSNRKPTVYGVLEADIGPDAVLALGLRSQRERYAGNNSVPRYSTGADLGLPRHTGLSPAWAGGRQDSRDIFAKLTWRVADRWTLRANATQTRDQGHALNGFALGAVDPISLQGARWFGSESAGRNRQNLLDLNLSGAFDLLGRTHELLVGADAQDIKSSWYSYRTDLRSGQTAVDVFNPGSTPWVPGSLQRGSLLERYEPNDTRQYGAYATLRLEVADGTKLVVGARANRFKYSQIYRSPADADGNEYDTLQLTSATRYQEPTKVVPFAGVVHDLGAQWTAYASYAEVFNPQSGYKAGPAPGTGLDPMRGSNAELGLKGELLDGKLNTAFALYRVVQNDRAVLDPRFPTSTILFAGNCCYVASGQVVSQGLDMEVSGEVARGVHVYGGYTYNHNRDKTRNAVFSSITPRHALKFWGTWRLPAAAAAWTLGGGATVNSKQYVSGTAASYNATTNRYDGPSRPFDYTQSGYAVWNLMAEYRFDPHWALTLNANNLFDKGYYRTVGSSILGNYYGEPRNWMLTLRGKF